MTNPQDSTGNIKDGWYQRSVQDTLEQLGTSADQGLSQATVAQRLRQIGPNELVERGGRTRLQILVEQFANILTLILLGAAMVSVALGEWVEAVVIVAIVILNGLLGYILQG